VLLLPLQGLATELTRLKAKNGWAIDSRLFAFALGLEFAAGQRGTTAEAAETAAANN
jgi:hypothetical protein